MLASDTWCSIVDMAWPNKTKTTSAIILSLLVSRNNRRIAERSTGGGTVGRHHQPVCLYGGTFVNSKHCWRSYISLSCNWYQYGTCALSETFFEQSVLHLGQQGLYISETNFGITFACNTIWNIFWRWNVLFFCHQMTVLYLLQIVQIEYTYHPLGDANVAVFLAIRRYTPRVFVGVMQSTVTPSSFTDTIFVVLLAFRLHCSVSVIVA